MHYYNNKGLGARDYFDIPDAVEMYQPSSSIGLKPHCIRCSHFKVDDVSTLEPSSKPPIRIVEDNVTTSLHQQRTP
jgi:hypothetical protein